MERGNTLNVDVGRFMDSDTCHSAARKKTILVIKIPLDLTYVRNSKLGSSSVRLCSCFEVIAVISILQNLVNAH